MTHSEYTDSNIKHDRENKAAIGVICGLVTGDISKARIYRLGNDGNRNNQYDIICITTK